MYPKRESLRFCQHCPTPLSEEEARKWHGCCRRCAQDTLDDFKALLMADFNDAERKLLNDCFDGVGLDEPKKARLPE